MKKNDIILVVIIIAAAAVFFLFQKPWKSGGTGTVRITIDGETFGTYSLDEDRTIDINETNRLKISGKSAEMIWADCPDQICVRHKSISKDGESIICLPNKVVVSIENSEKNSLDGVAQ